MKKLSILLGSLILASVVAKADALPPHGTSIEHKIEGGAAYILYDALTEEDSTIPNENIFTNECGNQINRGKVHEVTIKNTTRKVKIICSTFYCMGRKATCHLKETY